MLSRGIAACWGKLDPDLGNVGTYLPCHYNHVSGSGGSSSSSSSSMIIHTDYTLILVQITIYLILFDPN